MTDEQHAVEEVEELYRRRDEPDARATAESRIELPLMASKLKSFPLIISTSTMASSAERPRKRSAQTTR